LVSGAEFGLSEINNNLVDYAGELERYVIVLAHRCSSVFPDVECLVRRNTERDGSRQSAVGSFFSVHHQRDETAFANTATVIFEINRDGVFAGRQAVLGGKSGAIDAHEAVVKDRSALQQV
jgi:hypothetical protein